MPGPFIFIATNRLREGRFGAEQQRVPGLSRFIEADSTVSAGCRADTIP
jgi:hypothetical protein